MKNDRQTAYIRTIPKIFGYNFFDKDSVLNSTNVLYDRFVASIFPCQLTVNCDKTLSISTLSMKRQINALLRNNDEIIRNPIDSTEEYLDLSGDKVIMTILTLCRKKH